MNKYLRCIICEKQDANFKADLKAWKTLLNAAEIRGHEGILDFKNEEDEEDEEVSCWTSPFIVGKSLWTSKKDK